MEKRRLGQSGPIVSALGLGCMGLADGYGPATGEADDDVKLIQRALDLGMTLIDTADFYGPGTGERVVGRAVTGRRDDAIIATKFWFRTESGVPRVDGSPKHVKAACEDSLRRLGVDHIDLYYQARLDPEVPVEETVGAMADLVAAGMVRYIGLSEVSPRTLRRAHRVHSIAALQSEYSFWERHVEAEILPTCRDLGIGFVAYSPLGRGFLTGRFSRWDDLPKKDLRRQFPRFQGENLRHNRKVVSSIEEIVAAKNVTVAQLVLGWVLAQGADIIAIPGTRRIDHLEQNAGAVAVELSAADSARLAALFAEVEILGERYPRTLMQAIDRS